MIRLFIFTCFLSTTSICLADDGFFGGEGETVWPLTSKQIRMNSEEVNIKPILTNGFITKIEVECIFHFVNTGNEAEVTVGFPNLYYDGVDQDRSRGTINDFKCFVDNQPCMVQIKTGVQNPVYPKMVYPEVFIWKVHFAEGQHRFIKNTYNFRGSGTSDGNVYINYILKTGALWKGSIGSAIISIDIKGLDKDFITIVKPKGGKITGDKIRWILTNFEPKDDLEVIYNNSLAVWVRNTNLAIKNDSLSLMLRQIKSLERISWSKAPQLEEPMMKLAETAKKRFGAPLGFYCEILNEICRQNKNEVERQCMLLLNCLANTEITNEVATTINFIWLAGDICERHLENYKLAKSFYHIYKNIKKDNASIVSLINQRITYCDGKIEFENKWLPGNKEKELPRNSVWTLKRISYAATPVKLMNERTLSLKHSIGNVRAMELLENSIIMIPYPSYNLCFYNTLSGQIEREIPPDSFGSTFIFTASCNKEIVFAYPANISDSRIVYRDRLGAVTTSWPVIDYESMGIASDNEGNIITYSSYPGSTKFEVYSRKSNGSFEMKYTSNSGDNKTRRIAALCIDDQGSIYLSDTQSNSVIKISKDGNVCEEWLGISFLKLRWGKDKKIYGFTGDNDKLLYVLDTSGKVKKIFSTNDNKPFFPGLTDFIIKNDSIYICGNFERQVVKYSLAP